MVGGKKKRRKPSKLGLEKIAGNLIPVRLRPSSALGTVEALDTVDIFKVYAILVPGPVWHWVPSGHLF